MKQKKFEFLEHTADIKFQAFGKTIEDAFKNSALALKESIVSQIKIKEKIKKNILIQASSLEQLLYKFLEEFIFLLDSEDFIISKIKKIKIDTKKFILNTKILGDKASKYDFSNTVKAITYNEMFIRKQNDKYVVQVIVDV